MMVPRTRLILWFAFVVLPFAAVIVVPDGGDLPLSLTALALAAMTALVAIAVADALWGWRGFDDLGAELPEIVRLTKDRDGVVPVTVTNPGQRKRSVRIGLPLPPSLTTPSETRLALLPAAAPHALVDWPCMGTERGRYIVDGVYMETVSPLGFWAVRRRSPARTEVRVYPNLFSERRQVAALFLNRGGFGIHAQRQVGQGREFEKLREYQPGDSYDDIHWKATAKRGRPITKTYQLERTQEVYVVIDASRLSGRTVTLPRADGQPDVRVSQLERFITSGLVLGLAAERQNDLFGVVSFTDRIEAFIRAKNGAAHYDACRDAIYTLTPQRVSPDFDEVFSHIRIHLRRRALIVFLTNLDDPILAESFLRNVRLINRQHLVLVNMITSPRIKPLFTTGDVEQTDDVYDHLAGHMRWHDLRELDRVLHRLGVRFNTVDNARLTADLVTQYVNVKQRQML